MSKNENNSKLVPTEDPDAPRTQIPFSSPPASMEDITLMEEGCAAHESHSVGESADITELEESIIIKARPMVSFTPGDIELGQIEPSSPKDVDLGDEREYQEKIDQIISIRSNSVVDEPISVVRIDTTAKREFMSHAQLLARDLFNAWDVGGDGFICEEDIEHGGQLDPEFAQGFARCLDHDDSGQIHLEDVINTLNVLKLGTMAEKVKHVLKFMDKDRTGTVSYTEAELYLKSAPPEMCRRLGLMEEDGSHAELTYSDLLALFESSDRGEDAINIFCGHILRVLESRYNDGGVGSPLSVRNMRKLSMSAICALDIASHGNETCISTMEALIHEIPKSTMFLVALVFIQMALWVWNFMHYWGRDFPPSFCFAKGCGLNLRILTILLFLSMARTTMGYLFEIPLVRALVPMGFNIQVHSFLGFSTVLHSIGHMIGHIIYKEVHVSGGFGVSFTQKSLLNGGTWSDYTKGDGITGYILLVSLFVMAFTALIRGGSAEKYKIFGYAHYLYNVWIVFIFLHVPHLWPWFIFIGGIMIIERWYDFFMQTNHSTLVTSRPCDSGVTFLSVPRAGVPTYPGAYYRIKVPSISPSEWHPFSLAGSMSSHMLTFFISSAGDWTSQLYEIVSDPLLRESTAVMVQGPFYAPAHLALKDPMATTLLVASGIGITPFFSIMATKVTDEQSYETDRAVFESLFSEELEEQRSSGPANTFAVMGRMGRQSVSTSFTSKFSSSKSAKFEDTSGRGRKSSLQIFSSESESQIKMLRVVWSVREVSELMFYLDYVCELVKHQDQLEKPVVFVDIYLTGLGKGSDLKYMMSQCLFLLTVAKRTSSFMKIHFGRPDLDRVVCNIKPDQVYYCGGKFLKNSLADICIKYNVSFHPEDFDSGAHILPNTIKRVASLFSSSKRDGLKRPRSSTKTT